MIFVTVGSQKFPFNRLLKEIDRLVETGRIKEPVFAQTGYTSYVPKNYKYKTFLEREEFSKYLHSCDLVVTHGGTGTIVKAIKLGKKVVGVPRLKEFSEHVDDHQLQLIWQFTSTKMIASCKDISTLGDVIEKARVTEFACFESNTASILDDIDQYLMKL